MKSCLVDVLLSKIRNSQINFHIFMLKLDNSSPWFPYPCYPVLLILCSFFSCNIYIYIYSTHRLFNHDILADRLLSLRNIDVCRVILVKGTLWWMWQNHSCCHDLLGPPHRCSILDMGAHHPLDCVILVTKLHLLVPIKI